MAFFLLFFAYLKVFKPDVFTNIDWNIKAPWVKFHFSDASIMWCLMGRQSIQFPNGILMTMKEKVVINKLPQIIDLQAEPGPSESRSQLWLDCK